MMMHKSTMTHTAECSYRKIPSSKLGPLIFFLLYVKCSTVKITEEYKLNHKSVQHKAMHLLQHASPLTSPKQPSFSMYFLTLCQMRLLVRRLPPVTCSNFSYLPYRCKASSMMCTACKRCEIHDVKAVHD